MPATLEKEKKVSAWDKFREVVDNRHEYAQQWKQRTGGKAIGYMCTYVTEEVIYAAGVLPVRIMGSREPQDVTEPYIYGMYCPLLPGLLGPGAPGAIQLPGWHRLCPWVLSHPPDL